MADPVIVWSNDPDISGNLRGMVSGAHYYTIYPISSGYRLESSLPTELYLTVTDASQQTLKNLASEQLGKFLTVTKNQMTLMGLLGGLLG